MTTETTKQRPSADKTRADILNAAEQLFADKGFAATAISEVAKQAGVNQSLIYHHFGNKQSLWRAAKEAILIDYMALNVDTLKRPPESLKQFLTDFVSARFCFYDDNPNVVRIISWQRLEPNTEALQNIAGYQSKRQPWLDTLQQLQKQNEIRQDVNVEMMLVMIMNAASSLFFDVHPFLTNATADEKIKLKQQYLNMLIDSLWHGFKA